VQASVAVGLLWATWHLPLLLDLDGVMHRYPWLLWGLVTVAISSLYTWLFEASGGSILIVVVLHATGNTLGSLSPGYGPAEAVVEGAAALIASLMLVRRRSVRTEHPAR
jgi:membrane protease YdiL (CAAX protease family)